MIVVVVVVVVAVVKITSTLQIKSVNLLLNLYRPTHYF